MNEHACLTFRLWGIPVTIHPISWVMLLIIGGGLGVNSGQELAAVLLFVIAGMLCLLVHELGHALAGRKLTGSVPLIIIAGMGGNTYTPRLPRTRAGYFMLVLAGPLASLLLGLLGGAFFGLQIGHVAEGILFSLLYPLPIQMSPELILPVHESGMGHLQLIFYLQLFSVCVWWTIFNLLPIYPLDGGKLLGTLLGNEHVACKVGLVFACLLCTLCLLWALLGGGSIFNVFITAYLVYLNYDCLRQM